MENKLVTITPFMASELLKRNSDNNRNLRKSDVEKYAKDMVDGNWHLTHQGIAFDEDGKLVDGQHRLSAIVLSGVPVDMYVTTGVSRTSIKVIDSGLSRTMKDRMKTAGLDGVFRSSHSASFVNAANMILFGGKVNKKYSTDEMEMEISKYYNACKYATRHTGRFLGKAGAVIALISAMQTEPVCAVEAFVDCVNNNVIGKEPYNYKAALDYVRHFGSSIKYTSGNKDRYLRECDETQRAIYCFIHNRKTVGKKFPIYEITKEQLENFEYVSRKERQEDY